MEIDVKKILLLRRRLGISQEDVATKLNMSRVSYNLRERVGNFTDDQLSKLADLLNVKPAELLVEEKPRTRASMQELRILSARWKEERNNILQQLKQIEEKQFEEFLHKIQSTKVELAKELQQSIKEQTNFLHHAESKFHDRYINLLEIQLKDKQETILQFKEIMMKIESDMSSRIHQIIELNKSLQQEVQELKLKLINQNLPDSGASLKQ